MHGNSRQFFNMANRLGQYFVSQKQKAKAIASGGDNFLIDIRFP